MPIDIRTSDEKKRYLVQKLNDWEKITADIVAVKADMDAFTDAELADQMGLPSDEKSAGLANKLKSAYGAIAELNAQWNKSGQNAVLGIRLR